MYSKETIAAIATPLGEGGIAIVRISGEDALDLARTLFSKDITRFASHKAHVGHVIDRNGRKIDQTICLVMKGPHSFTGEDVVEFQCHGGVIAIRKVLEAALQAGARLASPGEFSYRAFMNGKIDLAQAESIQTLIGAKSEAAFIHAQRHLEGRLSQKVSGFQKDLITLAAILEAWVDFPEEDLIFASKEEIIERLKSIQGEMKELLATYEEGKRMQQGAKIVLMGAPNAGKSSLMNALLENSRAIVTALPGTTRDTIEAPFLLSGRSITLVDTAGLREASCEIEQLGIARSLEAMKEADLVLWVIDATEGEKEEAPSFLPKEKQLRIANKIDLAKEVNLEVDCKVSALEKVGIAELKKKIDQKLATLYTASQDEVVISSYRHHEALVEAELSLEKVIVGLRESISAEFLTADIKEALYALGKIKGQNVTEEILTSIFSQFCIGK